MNTVVLLSLSALLGQGPHSLHVSQPLVERGEVKSGQSLAVMFDLVNRGVQPMTITEVAVGCGCLRPRLSRKTIPPGESAELVVEVNTLSQPAGPNTWKTTIRYECGSEKGEQDLEIKANLIREISIDPVAVSLTFDRGATQTFTLTDRRAKPLSITAVQTSSTHLTAQIFAISVNAKGERTQQVTLTIADTLPPGRSTETMQLLTDDAEYRELRVPIMINRREQGVVQAMPDQLELRLARDQFHASGLIRLRDPDDRNVMVDRVEVDHPGIRAKWAAGPANMTTLRLSVELSNANRTGGTSQVKVHVKEPKPQMLIIPVSWHGQ